MSDKLLLDAGDSSVLIDGGHVAAVGQDARILGEGSPRLDVSGGLIRGAAVNAHTHLYSALAPLGMPPPEVPPQNFLEILQRIWWRLDRALDADSLRAAARLCIAESLLAGTTVLIDHHESPEFIEGSLDVLGDAAAELGIRLATGYGATERNNGRGEAIKGLKECGRFAHSNNRPNVRPLVALHASFTVSDQTAVDAGHLARELSVPVHVHVAEDMADTLDAHKRGYEGALHRLARLDALPPGSILAHGVDLDDPIAHLADTNGFWLVQNPRSNKNNRVGWPYALGATGRVALGSDGFPSDMQAEWLACADGMIENADRRAADDPEQLARRRGGGHRLATERFGEAFSALPVPGAAADLAVYEVPGVLPVVVQAALEDVDIFRTRRKTLAGLSRPRHVICAGRLVVKDGRLLTADEAAIRADANVQAARLWQRMAEVA